MSLQESRTVARRRARDLLDAEVLPDVLDDAVRSDEAFLHLAGALKDLDHADRSGFPESAIRGPREEVEDLARGRLDQIIVILLSEASTERSDLNALLSDDQEDGDS